VLSGEKTKDDAPVGVEGVELGRWDWMIEVKSRIRFGFKSPSGCYGLMVNMSPR